MDPEEERRKRGDKLADTPMPADKDPAPAKPAAADDKLGQLADTASPDPIKDSLDVVQHSFHWFNEAAQRGIEKLRGDLKREDEPAWWKQLAGALLDVALGAGAAAAGARLAQHLTAEAEKEFVKMLWEGGINAGVTAGLAKLSGGKDGNVVDPFIDSQKEAVEAKQIAAQTNFIKTKRHQVKTTEEAQRLEAAHSESNVKAAAVQQYEATRDAWVSYLAQTKYGAIKEGGGAVQKDSLNIGNATTNMSTQETRDRTNKGAPGFVPEDAPSMTDAVYGDAQGVLFVKAELPEIDESNQMSGKPSVELALLNGVNGTIRGQYQGKPLGEINIPRQIVAEVDGDPDFTVNLNEKGESNYLKPKPRTWLAKRALVGHPENASKDEWTRSNEGLQLLLKELIPGSIKKQLWGD